MIRYLTLLALLVATLSGGLAAAALAVRGVDQPAQWATALRGLAPEPALHELLGPISAAGRGVWNCWPQREAESPTLDPVFPGETPSP